MKKYIQNRTTQNQKIKSKLINYFIHIVFILTYHGSQNSSSLECWLLIQTISRHNLGLSAGTGKLCIFGHLGLVFIWSCFVSCLLLLLYYVICAPVLTEGTHNLEKIFPTNSLRKCMEISLENLYVDIEA